jgi:hypothetical protein
MGIESGSDDGYLCAVCDTVFETEQARNRHLNDMGLLY